MWKRVLRTADEASYEAAVAKSDAAQARHDPPVPGAPAPREVFAEVCAELGARLEPVGFRYARSGPHVTRKVGPMREQITFGTSRNNVRGRSVSLDLAMNVCIPGLESWRKAHQRPNAPVDWFAGGIFGRLFPDAQHLVWNVANPARRADAIDDVVAMIEQYILPWFARFEDLDSLAVQLERGDLPLVSLLDAVEALLWLGRRDAAVRVVRGFLGERPDVRSEYEDTVRRFERKGFPPWDPTTYVEQLAFAAVAHDVRPER